MQETNVDRAYQAEYLKEQLAMLLNDKGENPVAVVHVNKELFIEMAFCFIAKHGK